MSTVRLRCTMTFEYDADPEWYEDTSLEGMCKTDVSNAEEDPHSLLSIGEDNGSVKITIVPVEEGSDEHR